MIRFVIWFIALAVVAIASALFVADNAGMVSIFWQGKRIDLSLNLLILGLLIAMVLGYALLSLINAISKLPEQAQQYRQQQHQNQLYQLLTTAMVQLGAGRFSRAQKSAEKALEHGRLLKHGEQNTMLKVRALGHYLVAESAHRLGKYDKRETHYEQGMALAKRAKDENGMVMLDIRKANWLLHETDARGALEQLQSLPKGAQRRVLALRLKLKASRLAQNTKTALETARLLNKHGAFSESTGRSLVQSLAMHHLNQQHDIEQIKKAWEDLHETERGMPAVTALAGKRVLNSFTKANIHQSDSETDSQQKERMEQAKQWLMPMWKRYHDLQPELQWQLIQNTITGLNTVDNTWLRTIEKQQNNHPHDNKLRYLAGIAYLKRQLWGKAQQMFERITQQTQRATPHTPFNPSKNNQIEQDVQQNSWCYLALLAQQRGDIEAANHAWNKAHVDDTGLF